MKQVLVILPYANKHLELFIQYIKKHYEVDYFIHGSADKYRKNIKNNAIEIHSLDYYSTCKNLLNKKYVIVFTHGIFYPYLFFLHLVSRATIVILSEGFTQNFNTGLKGFIKRLHINQLSRRNNINLFMLGDSSIKNQYEQLVPNKIKYYTYGMFPSLSVLQNNKSTHQNPVKFVYAGQFIKRKNIQLILDSITQTPQFQNGEAEFTFIGEGEEFDKINSNPNVKLHNSVSKENLHILLSNADVVVLVSSYEGWGAIVNEACSCGCALILSRAVGAATLLFENNVNGYFTETSQVALSNTFKEIMQDRKKLSEMKKASADIFTKVYEEHDQQLTDIIAQATKFDLSK